MRDSTLAALRLTCPSADVLHRDQPSSPSASPDPVTNPFLHGDDMDDWSTGEDEYEDLIPAGLRTVSRSRFAEERHDKARAEALRANAAGHESWARSPSSSSPSSSGERFPLDGAPPVPPPRSPSRPEDVVQRLYQVTRERDALRRQMRDLRARQMADGTATAADAEKSLKWDTMALRHSIRMWTEDYFSGRQTSSWSRRSGKAKRPHAQSSRKLFGTLSDNPAAYLKDPCERPRIMQAFLWRQLHHRIFSRWDKGCGYIWAGRLGDRKLRPLADTLRKGA